jgi:hypothetical protein
MRTSQRVAILFFFGVVTTTGACGLNVVGQATSTDSIDASVDSGELSKPGDETTPTTDANTPDVKAPDVDADAKDPGPYGNRVTNELLVLYDFEEGKGTVIHDKADDPNDLTNALTITDKTNVTWQPHALAINGNAIIQSDSALTKIAKICGGNNGTNEISIEAWVESATENESNYNTYAPIVTMADSNSTTQNFALGTYTHRSICTPFEGFVNCYEWWASIQSSKSPTSVDITVTTDLTHLVATRTNDGALSLYVNGESISTPTNTESLENWNNYLLTLGNMPQGGQGWQGTMHLIAIYSRALTPTEITTNFNAGADPTP